MKRAYFVPSDFSGNFYHVGNCALARLADRTFEAEGHPWGDTDCFGISTHSEGQGDHIVGGRIVGFYREGELLFENLSEVTFNQLKDMGESVGEVYVEYAEAYGEYPPEYLIP